MSVSRKQWMVVALVIAGAVALSPVPASGQDSRDQTRVSRSDNRPDPLTTRQLEMKEVALRGTLHGKKYGRTGEVARGQYVQLARQGEGAVWTVLGEFADVKHNEIPEPDRVVNNTTIWAADFNRTYFLNLLFGENPGANSRFFYTTGVNSMRNFYIEQSSGRYTVHGDVTDWVAVPGNAATYDDDLNNPEGSQINAVWYFLADSVNGWYSAQIAAGKTPAQIDAYLSQFDVWDRYDYDGDGNFDEPDGYIDTFQSVHAGEGNEAGGGSLGDAAIWSHSWYAFYQGIGTTGPAFNPAGGFQIGASSYWVGKYTIQPENGGVGVFTHEYGHDLGLPDLYDTTGGDNGTGFWTLMSSGSWMNDGTVDIGSKSSHMGAWEKFQLGWLNYEVARAGVKSEHKLGPMETNTKQAQGFFVILPKKTVTTSIGTPFAGSYFYYSGAGDNLDNTMTKSVTLPAGVVSVAAKVRYNIEVDWDYAYLYSSTGPPWMTNLSTTADPNGQNFGFGITGASSGWVDLTADLSAFAGQAITLGFRYWTDTNTGGFGFMVDELAITSFPVDGAETDAGWTFAGFRRSTGTESASYNHYYVAEYRTYMGYDRTLKVGPYYFGYPNNPALVDFVDHFAYQDGLLINYWDTSQSEQQHQAASRNGLAAADRRPSQHPLPRRWRPLAEPHPDVRLDVHARADGRHSQHPPEQRPVAGSQPPRRTVVRRSDLYYDPTNPQGSVMNPNTGTQVRIQSISAQSGFMQVEVRPAK